jgi:ABC-2 type transport system ATP-binding protein
VQQVCDRVAILARGKCIAQGPVADVLARGHGARMVVKVPDPVAAAQILTDAGFDASAEGDRVILPGTTDDGASITQALAAKKIYLSELRPLEVSLEEVFLELTGGDLS